MAALLFPLTSFRLPPFCRRTSEEADVSRQLFPRLTLLHPVSAVGLATRRGASIFCGVRVTAGFRVREIFSLWVRRFGKYLRVSVMSVSVGGVVSTSLGLGFQLSTFSGWPYVGFEQWLNCSQLRVVAITAGFSPPLPLLPDLYFF
ncbi:hypothetical protein FKM82_028393 [Ascaphus truei]